MAATNNKAKTNKMKTPYIKASIDRLTDGNTSLKAYASATIGGSFVITGIKVCDGKNVCLHRCLLVLIPIRTARCSIPKPFIR